MRKGVGVLSAAVLCMMLTAGCQIGAKHGKERVPENHKSW